MTLDKARRDAIRRNHTACHMLQAALRSVLGTHVEQAGSYVDDSRVRFDFSHFSAMSEEELTKVEQIVNEKIMEGLPVCTLETDIESAKAEGAMALFGEKYGSIVRMVKIDGFSTELCGGTHVNSTGNIGLFKIISESSVAAGVRRIEGTTGSGVLAIIDEKNALITETAKELKCQNSNDIAKKAGATVSELKATKAEIESLEAKIANSKLEGILSSAKDVSGLTLICGRLDGSSIDAARTMCDDIKAKNPASVTLLALVTDGRLNFICSCGKDAVAKGAHAGKIVKDVACICGGGGGGRPDNATAGGKDLSKIDAALAAAEQALSKCIK